MEKEDTPSSDGITDAVAKRWAKMLYRQREKSIDVSRDAAKALLQVLGFVIPGYFAGLVAIFKGGDSPIPNAMIAPLWVWVLSLAMAVAAIVPITGKAYNIEMVIERFNRNIVWRGRLVFLSAVVLVIGMIVMMVCGVGYIG